MPELLTNIIPESLSVVILLLILSASMSTLAALVLISSSSIAKDIYAGFINPGVSDRTLTTLMRTGSAFFIMLSVILAYFQPATIVSILGISWGAIGSVFLGPFMWGMFSKKVNDVGAISASVLGLGTCLVLYVMMGPASSPQAGSIGMIVSGGGLPVVQLPQAPAVRTPRSRDMGKTSPGLTKAFNTRYYFLEERGMRKYTLLIITILLGAVLHGALLRNLPTTVTQPDGTTFDCLASGDEFFNYLHDENHFTIIQSQEDGYYYYAVLQNGKPVPSQYKVNEVEPVSVGLVPRALISEEAYQQKRRAFEETMRDGSRMSSIGTVNNLVVYIRFADQTEFTNPPHVLRRQVQRQRIFSGRLLRRGILPATRSDQPPLPRMRGDHQPVLPGFAPALLLQSLQRRDQH